jgi:hypothetical protein
VKAAKAHKDFCLKSEWRPWLFAALTPLFGVFFDNKNYTPFHMIGA